MPKKIVSEIDKTYPELYRTLSAFASSQELKEGEIYISDGTYINREGVIRRGEFLPV